MTPGAHQYAFDDRAADHTPVYVISVAAQLAGMHPQTLRQYDRIGLVSPSRTSGRGRRYSARDVRRLRYVQRLSQDDGVNLAGIQRILELERQVEQMQEQLVAMRAEALRMIAESNDRAAARVFAAGPTGVQTMSRRARGRSPWRPPLELVAGD